MQINVTKPFLPPKADYQRYVDDIWKRVWLTNNGPLVNELEMSLKKYLDIPYLLYVSNGTSALQIAIKALNLSGDIITTPFSYIATTSSILWEACNPVMVDVCNETLNLNPDLIKAAITPTTTGILATHVYGNPCDVFAIEEIAKEHNLSVIYDAAHAFGVRYHGKSLYAFGDVATASFHATKVFHTIEGGAVFARNPKVLERLALLRNFGHITATEFGAVGINAKNSEFHAAMGLCNLPHIDRIIEQRRLLSTHYDSQLDGLPIRRPTLSKNCEYNYAYYPIIFKEEALLIRAVELLNLNNIFPRRYFFPSLNVLQFLPAYRAAPVSENVSTRVLCLPLYDSLTFEEVSMICRLIHRSIRYQ